MHEMGEWREYHAATVQYPPKKNRNCARCGTKIKRGQGFYRYAPKGERHKFYHADCAAQLKFEGQGPEEVNVRTDNVSVPRPSGADLFKTKRLLGVGSGEARARNVQMHRASAEHRGMSDFQRKT